METINPSFEKELEQLRDRLEEAEDVRRAITRGEVDAFVVGPGGNARVLLLANAYQRYRQLVEKMQQGAVTATLEGHVLFANQRFADMLGIPISRIYAAPLENYVVTTDRARLSAYLLLCARDSRIEVELARSDGATIPVRLSLVSFADGYVTLLITDLRPVQWPSLAVDTLESLRTSVENLNRNLADNAGARQSLADISEQINGLARMIDEMIDVESMGGARQ